jgi:TolB-like protein/DNA-binding winged helix-turn-helix (wHTH) protein/Tfp pilus assembly protein PilF
MLSATHKGHAQKMKYFQSFRLDAANHCLWRDEVRVPIAPKTYDVLRYLVENPGRLVTQEELLEELWADTYINPEGIRRYILELRKILGDRLDKPEFIETVPKRGYRFIARVIDAADPPISSATHHEETTIETTSRPETTRLSGNGSHQKRTLWKIAIASVAIIAATAIPWLFQSSRNGARPSPLPSPSIAVLPFRDVSPSKDQEYFSEGLAEQLINDLAQVSDLKVVGRSSSFRFKGENQDLHDVGRKLGVANVLEGSVRREGNHVRVTAELIKADDGFQLWSQTYDREINDIFAVQDEIAQAAAEALKVKLLGSNGQPLRSNFRSANPEAYQAFLQANYFLGQGHGKEDLARALASADQAIRLDPKYAPAWALRATVQNRMAGFSLTDITEGSQRARDDAERAITLDPTSASGYLALARTQNDYDWDWNAANASLTKAAALEPGSVEVLRLRSYLSRELGDLDLAIKLYQEAIALDPLRTDFHLGLGHLLYVAGRNDEAPAELERALDLNLQAAFVHVTLGKILIAKGKPQQALAEIEKEPSGWAKLTGQVLVYHALGRDRDSNVALAALIEKYGSDSAFQIAQAYAFRGQIDKSFEWLERAYKQRDGGLIDIKVDPLLKNLHGDARFAELLRKMHLPE